MSVAPMPKPPSPTPGPSRPEPPSPTPRPPAPTSENCDDVEYTVSLDFDKGDSINVNSIDVADQLQLNNVATPFKCIWVAASARGTIIKVDTETGDILGEYLTTPGVNSGSGNPSRTTVDNDGSVWVANRNGNPGSVVHVGLLENGQCEDRNGNGVIDTSTGLGDIKPWGDLSGTRNVATAEDECIVSYTASLVKWNSSRVGYPRK